MGTAAETYSSSEPTNTIASAKRMLGRSRAEFEDDPYVALAEGEGLAFNTDAGSKTPVEVSSAILNELKLRAEPQLTGPIAGAVITVPAYFDDAQRQATRQAAELAGVKVLRLLNEPTAAAVAYGLDEHAEESSLLAVYDLGGGTFDVSILEIYQVDGQPQIEVKATSGDNRLGGDDFDEVIITWLVDEYKKDTGIDLSTDSQAMSRLREHAEKAKIELSGSGSAQVNLPFITSRDGQPEHLDITLSKSKFEELIEPLISRTLSPTRQAMKDAGVSKGKVDKVILVGGSTRVPAVQSAIEQEVGKAPFKGVNPDEAVAMGAALQAGIIVGDSGVTDVLLLDVTPLTLGIETLGGVMTTMIERNTTIPSKRSETFSTAADNQPAVEVHVLQGERQFAKDNITLGKFHLTGIPAAPRGIPQIEVTFDIDANGIVNVSAKDLGTGKEQKITIESQTSLSEDEIKSKIAEAEEFADEDRKRKARVELKNQAESIVYQTRKTIEEAGDKLEEDDTEPVLEKLNELESMVMDGDTPIDVDEIDEAGVQSKISELEGLMQALSIKIYEAAAKDMEEDNQEDESDDGVHEADFEVVEDED